MRDGNDQLLALLSNLTQQGQQTPYDAEMLARAEARDNRKILDAAPDVSGTRDMGSLIQQGLTQSKRDLDIMNNLPDISGTNNLMTRPPMDVATPTPLQTPSTPEVPEEVATKKTLPKRQTKSPEIKKSEEPAPEKPQQKEPSIEDKMSASAKMPDKDTEMLDAQQQRKDNLQLLAMLSGSQQIGAGLARQRPDENYTKDLQQLADLPVSDLKEGRAAKDAMEKQSMDRQKFTLDSEMGKINFAKAKMGLEDEKERSNANSKASQLARASTIDSLTRMGRKDLAKQITPEMSAFQIEKLFGNMNMSNMVTAYESQQNRIEMSKMRAEAAAAQRQEKVDQKDVSRLDTASKLIAADLARNNTAFGRNANIIRSSDAIEVLVSGKKPNDVTPQQAFEMAKSLDAMLSAGGTTMSGTEHLMPKGAMMKYASLAEFFKNEPQAAMQGGYVKQVMDTIKRERALAQSKIHQTSGALLGSYMDLAKKHPESWGTMLRMHGLDPAQVGNKPVASEPVTSQYSPADEAGIASVMQNNKIDRATAIKALRDAGKIK